jgi:threonine/homoserine/homoserine lactone efflux protein
MSSRGKIVQGFKGFKGFKGFRFRVRVWVQGSSIYHARVIWSFLAVTVPLVLTPGASTAVVLRNSLEGGTRAGLQTAVGVNTGSLVLGLLCAFGFAVALSRWPGVWWALRIVGCVYLAWLGLRSITRALRPPVVVTSPTAPVAVAAHKNFREGFLTNMSNPALATFYFLILPQFVPRGAPVVQWVLLLTAIHIALAFSWHAVWAAAGGTLVHILAAGRIRRALDAAAGVALILLAIKLLV